jgi:hypothetical protein
MVLLMRYAGLRASDVVTLSRDHVNSAMFTGGAWCSLTGWLHGIAEDRRSGCRHETIMCWSVLQVGAV